MGHFWDPWIHVYDGCTVAHHAYSAPYLHLLPVPDLLGAAAVAYLMWGERSLDELATGTFYLAGLPSAGAGSAGWCSGSRGGFRLGLEVLMRETRVTRTGLLHFQSLP